MDLSHTQTRSIVGTGYRVRDVVTATTGGMKSEVFVFKVADDRFSRVASPSDLEELPAAKADAIAAGKDHYRLATVTQDFPLLVDAVDFGAYIKARLKVLVSEYNTAVSSFVGEDIATVTP
jgi:hypothetical protein